MLSQEAAFQTSLALSLQSNLLGRTCTQEDSKPLTVLRLDAEGKWRFQGVQHMEGPGRAAGHMPGRE